jgi:hypothetical protein
MLKSRYLNPAEMVANTLSDIHINKMGIMPKAGLDKDGKQTVENDCLLLYNEIRNGNLDFVTDALASHVIILNNIVAVCHRKASSGSYFKEFTELSIKATDQLRKSGLALAQIKNVIINIENLTLQQNNLLQLNTGQQIPKPTQEVIYGKTVVTT